MSFFCLSKIGAIFIALFLIILNALTFETPGPKLKYFCLTMNFNLVFILLPLIKFLLISPSVSVREIDFLPVINIVFTGDLFNFFKAPHHSHFTTNN